MRCLSVSNFWSINRNPTFNIKQCPVALVVILAFNLDQLGPFRLATPQINVMSDAVSLSFVLQRYTNRETGFHSFIHSFSGRGRLLLFADVRDRRRRRVGRDRQARHLVGLADPRVVRSVVTQPAASTAFVVVAVIWRLLLLRTIIRQRLVPRPRRE